MPRYVVLAHHTTPFHYDLMIERGDALATWSFDEPPGRHGQACRRIKDHRKAYLDYEGEVSGGRGRVERWDAGTCEATLCDDDAEVFFDGRILSGRWRLVRTGDAWEMRRA